MKKNKEKILVVCHDAGGSEIISAYVRKNAGKKHFFCLVSGPGEKVFKRKGLRKLFIRNNKKPLELLAMIKPDFILAGNSGGSSLYLDFIRAGKKAGVKSIIYVDHWTDFRRGLGYPRKNWKENLPNEFWAGDKHGLRLIKKLFPRQKIKLIPNLYFKERKDEYEKIRKVFKNRGGNILFMSEPMSSTNCFGDKPNYGISEYEVLKKLLDYFSKKEIKNKFVICFHPSEKNNKFDRLISEYAGKLRIAKQSRDILKEFSEASLVIGMMSMILTIACICGKKTISFIPNKKTKCPLPFPNIVKINKVEELNKFKL